MQAQIGPEIIRSYKRLSYTVWHALAEFVDNSIQSYVNHQEELDQSYYETGQGLTVDIRYRHSDGGSLAIRDNGMGMSQTELSDALWIGRPPEDKTGLSEFGMGLKTAACWFGNQWTVRTKKLGETEGHSIRFDVEQVASGDSDLHHETFSARSSEHYTEISISDLNQRIYGRAYARIRSFLASMYRVKTKENALTLIFNGDELHWDSPIEADNLHVSDGEECFKSFSFEIEEKEVSGWVAILERGSRSDAGFTIIRRGRVIRGWPDSWRPQTIYGQYEGSNDLVNQRLIGEINLDDFGVSHTKDDILWAGDDQEILELELADYAQPYIDIATTYRKHGTRGKFPSKSVVTSALGMLEDEMNSSRFRAVVARNGSIPRSLYESSADLMIRAARGNDPQRRYSIHGLTLRVFLAEDLSERDPYLGIDIDRDNALSVVINMRHPHVRDLQGRIGVLNHLRSCTYEGIAQWKVSETWNAHNPSLIRAIKDSLLRVGHSIDRETMN